MENEKDDNDNVVRAMLLSGGNSLTNHPGFPYSKKPVSLTGFFDYDPKEDDSCYIFLYLTRFNVNTSSRETIGSGMFSSSEKTGDYSQFVIPINYVSTPLPDSAYILIYAGSFIDPQDGSRLFIDALSFDEEGTTGINETMSTVNTLIFPNPANDHLNISLNEFREGSIVEIIDATGIVKSVIELQKNNQVISVQNLSAGIYHYRILKKEHELVKQGKIVIN